jgi:hypothetical protein
MYMRNIFAAGAALGLSVLAHADKPWILCEECVSNDAESVALGSGHLGEIGVFSLRNRFFSKFENEVQLVGKDCEPPRGERPVPVPNKPRGTFRAGNCTYQIVATPSTMSPEEDQLNAALLGFYDQNGGSMKTLVEVSSADLGLGNGPVTGATGGSAHDYNNNFEYARLARNAAVARVLNDPTPTSWANIGRLVVGSGSVLVLGADGTKITIVITFEDGSRVALTYTERSDPDSEQVLSAEGRPVMTSENASHFAGDLPMDNALSLNNFLENARLEGITIVRGDVTVTGGHVSCSTVHSNDGTVTTTCHAN